jgi:hypothetical protein
VVGVPLDPLSLVQPGQHLLQESISITLTRVDAKLGEPDRLVECLVKLGEVVLEVINVGPCVVVGDNEVDLAVTAASHEALQVVDALVGISAVGYSGRADFEALGSKGLDVFLVCGNSLVDGNVGASATVVELADSNGTCLACCKTYPT